MSSEPRIVEVRERVLKQNDLLARELRADFDERAFTSSVSFRVQDPARRHFSRNCSRVCAAIYRVGALVGDLATDNDAARLQRSGAPVKQITTGTICHLDASMVSTALDQRGHLRDFDLLFIENVGNLVCPSSYDLGEHLRMVVLSVTEGEDKPLKYPTIFNYRRYRRHHQNGSRQRSRIRLRVGAPKHPDCTSRHARSSGLCKDGRRHGSSYSVPLAMGKAGANRRVRANARGYANSSAH